MIFIGWLLGPVLTIFACLAIKDVLLSPSLAQVNKQRAEIRNWPHVKGTLEEVYICAVTSHGKYSHDFCSVAVGYKYEVKGHKYVKQPNVLINNGRLDLASFVSRDALRRDDQGDEDNSYNTEGGGFKSAYQNCRLRLSAFLEPEDKEHLEQIGEDELLHKFFPHRQIEVFFNPSNPAISTLDNNLDDLNWSTYFGSQLIGPGIGLFIGLTLCLADLAWFYILFFSKEPAASSAVNSAKLGTKDRANHLLESAQNKYLKSTDGDIIRIKAEDQWQVEKPHDKPQ